MSERECGDKVLVSFSDMYIYKTNPISPSWDVRIVDAIKRNSLIIGMTDRQAMLSWGKPNKINRTHTARGTNEQWVYQNNSYLYFENDVLVAIQN